MTIAPDELKLRGDSRSDSMVVVPTAACRLRARECDFPLYFGHVRQCDESYAGSQKGDTSARSTRQRQPERSAIAINDHHRISVEDREFRSPSSLNVHLVDDRRSHVEKA